MSRTTVALPRSSPGTKPSIEVLLPNTVAPAGRTDLAGATPEELADATRAVTCYAGRYELKDGEVHHHVEMALSPNMIGQTMIRRVHFDGPNLTLSARPDAQGHVRRILWRRVETK